MPLEMQLSISFLILLHQTNILSWKNAEGKKYDLNFGYFSGNIDSATFKKHVEFQKDFTKELKKKRW